MWKVRPGQAGAMILTVDKGSGREDSDPEGGSGQSSKHDLGLQKLIYFFSGTEYHKPSIVRLRRRLAMDCVSLAELMILGPETWIDR